MTGTNLGRRQTDRQNRQIERRLIEKKEREGKERAFDRNVRVN